MRFYFFGPRVFGVRPGISFTPDDLHQASSFAPPPFQGQTQGNIGAFVYVIRGEHDHCKIGVSANPTARLAQLQTSSPFPLSFAYIGAASGRSYSIEREAHRLLGNTRQKGEWFDCPPEMAIAAVTGGAARIGERLQTVSVEQVGQILAIAHAQNAVFRRPTLSDRIIAANMVIFRAIFAIVGVVIFLGAIGVLGIIAKVAVTNTP